jgi:hypothetical protein
MTTTTVGDTRQATAIAQHWIDGSWRDSAEHKDSINPATGEVIGRYALALPCASSGVYYRAWASAIALQAHREREESTPPDDQLQPGESEADWVILDQPIFPFRRLAVIAEYRRPRRVDRSGAPLHRLADWHHSGDPGNPDGEAEEAEHQADRGGEHRQCASVLSAE